MKTVSAKSVKTKTIKVLDKTLDTVVTIVCILLLLIGLYSMLDNLWVYQNAVDKSILAYKPDLDAVLAPDKVITENQVAWVYIHDTTIDYPVMQGVDNTEYLNKDPYGAFSLSGSIFLDFRNDKNLKDPYSLVYGHHMAQGAMFGALDDFTDRAFFDAHRSGKVVTAEKVYGLTLFAVASADATDPILFDPSGRTTSEIIAYLQGRALILTDPEPNRPILALSTCSGDTHTARLLVFGTLTER